MPCAYHFPYPFNYKAFYYIRGFHCIKRHQYSSSASPREASGYNTSLPARKRGMAESISRTTKHLNLIQLNQLLNVLHKKRRIIALVGAGISVSAGIPNFRSTARLFNTPGNRPFRTSLEKDLFNTSVYHNDVSTSSFHDILRTLSTSTRSAKPTAFHHLLATLAHNGRLLRLYSQNVNGINTTIEPLRTKLHRCVREIVYLKCYRVSNFQAELFNGPIQPICADYKDNNKFRIKAGKRSHGNPNDKAIRSVIMSDLRARPDAFIVASTTLKVLGVRRIIREICRLVRDQVEAAPKGKDLENC
ncbi:DHS-like NAD/FAD-binding domain-containing protein [Cenococcum geophilum]